MVEEAKGEDFYSRQLQRHLRSILEASAKGVNSDGYRSLINELIQLKYKAFSQQEEDAEYNICNLLEILTVCVSSIQQVRHSELINEIYTMPMWQCHQDLRKAMLDFLHHLAVVSPTTTQQTLQTLILDMSLPFALAKEYHNDGGNEWQPTQLITDLHNDIVDTIAKLMEDVPMTSNMLTQILARGLPSKYIAKPVQCTFLHGLFQIANLPRAAALRDQIMEAIVQHLVGLDVEIAWQDIAWSPDDEDDLDDEAGKEGDSDKEPDIFELEGTTAEIDLDPTKFQDGEHDAIELKTGEIAEQRMSGRGGFEGEAQDNEPTTSGRTPVDENADKLDCMMCLVFKYFEDRINAGDTALTWKALLRSFHLTVLNTYRSKFTQYLLWFFLMKDSHHASKEFLQTLLAVLSDPRQPDINRSAAAAYIASYLARSAFLPSDILVEAIQKLAGWCSEYCKVQTRTHISEKGFYGQQGISATPVPQSVIHQVFHASCQGLLYVLCYRMEQLYDISDGGNQDHKAAMSQLFRDIMPGILGSRLAPLKVCLPTVVTEFSRLSLRLGLLDSTTLPQEIGTQRCQRPLEMFFPFDPYLLRHSSQFLDLKHTFVRWRGGHSQTAEQEEQSSSDTEEEDMDAGDETSSESSGIDSQEGDSNDEASQLADEFQSMTPTEAVPVERLGNMISARRHQHSLLGTSYSSGGTGSPTQPMSWTMNAHENLIRRCGTLLRPLDVQD